MRRRIATTIWSVLRCSKIVDLESAELDRIALPKGKPHGFDVCDFSVQLMGICQECRKEENTDPSKENEHE